MKTQKETQKGTKGDTPLRVRIRPQVGVEFAWEPWFLLDVPVGNASVLCYFAHSNMDLDTNRAHHQAVVSTSPALEMLPDR